MRPRRAVPVLLAVLTLPGACAARYEVDGARALARVRWQVEAGPRVPGTPGHAAVLHWLTAELTRLGGRVELQSFADTIDGRRLALTNVLASFGPGPTDGFAGRRVVLCAHWDSRPWSDRDPDPAHRRDPVPGANDGGSGVAVLLEVAELMHRRPPRVGVDLAFFDGEDQGRADRPEEFCLGARAYAARLTGFPAEARPAAAFLFDMVGDRDLEIHPEVNSARRAANLVELVMDGARATGARHFRSDPRWNLTDDHIPLLDAGIPAVDIVDFDFPAWHTRRDQPDQVSAASLAEVARVAAWLVYASPLAAAP